MAECKVSKTIKYVLYLSEEEAAFIKSMCQNSIMEIALTIDPNTPESELVESEKTKKIRSAIFEAINDTHYD